jgi:chromosome segregation ATPase
MREQVKDQRNNYEAQLAAQEHDIQKEGGDLTADLSKWREREKKVRARNEELSTALARSTATFDSLEQSLAQELAQVVAVQDRAVVAERATALLEQQLDEMQASHSKQLQ